MPAAITERRNGPSPPFGRFGRFGRFGHSDGTRGRAWRGGCVCLCPTVRVSIYLIKNDLFYGLLPLGHGLSENVREASDSGSHRAVDVGHEAPTIHLHPTLTDE